MSLFSTLFYSNTPSTLFFLLANSHSFWSTCLDWSRLLQSSRSAPSNDSVSEKRVNHELLGWENPMAPTSLDASLARFLLVRLLKTPRKCCACLGWFAKLRLTFKALAGSDNLGWSRAKKTIVAICVTETHSGHTKSTPRWRNQRATSPRSSCDFLLTHSPTLFHCFYCRPGHFWHCSSLFASLFIHSFLPNLVPICNLDSLFFTLRPQFSPRITSRTNFSFSQPFCHFASETDIA